MTKRVLVTGSSGFIGTNLCQRLISDDYDVIGADIDVESDVPGMVTHVIDLVRSRGEEFHDFVRDVGDVDAVIHLAGSGGVRQSLKEPAFYVEQNATMTARLAAAFSATRFIFASSSSVYGCETNRYETAESNPISPYGASKVAAEHVLYSMSKCWDRFSPIILRLFTAYGPHNRADMAMSIWADQISRGEAVQVNDELGVDVMRDWTYVGDICDAFILAIGYDRQRFDVFNVGHGDPIGVRLMVSMLSNAMGKGNPTMVKAMGRKVGDPAATHACVDRARQILGWQPKTSRKTGLSHFVRWYEAVVGATSK